MSSTQRIFLDEAARYLHAVYVPRLEKALATLPASDLWWRPHSGVMAFGNILLHLEGNVRQWILSGLGDVADHRNRAGEFSAEDGPAPQTLVERLRETVTEAAELIRSWDETRLDEKCVIQGKETTTSAAILHVIEHFSWHTGQAVWIAKARAGADHGLAFYDDAEINEMRNT